MTDRVKPKTILSVTFYTNQTLAKRRYDTSYTDGQMELTRLAHPVRG